MYGAVSPDAERPVDLSDEDLVLPDQAPDDDDPDERLLEDRPPHWE